MGEGIRHDDAARLLLQAIIAHRARGVHRRLDIALLDDVLHAIGVMRPHARQAIGLQLDPHRYRISAAAVALRLVALRGLESGNTKQCNTFAANEP